jgi:hypothetical protein
VFEKFDADGLRSGIRAVHSQEQRGDVGINLKLCVVIFHVPAMMSKPEYREKKVINNIRLLWALSNCVSEIEITPFSDWTPCPRPDRCVPRLNWHWKTTYCPRILMTNALESASLFAYHCSSAPCLCCFSIEGFKFSVSLASPSK